MIRASFPVRISLPSLTAFLFLTSLGATACNQDEGKDGDSDGKNGSDSADSGDDSSGSEGVDSSGVDSSGLDTIDVDSIDAGGGAPNPVGNGKPEICDGKDNNADGLVDNVDAGNDGVCDCLKVATLGERAATNRTCSSIGSKARARRASSHSARAT